MSSEVTTVSTKTSANSSKDTTKRKKQSKIYFWASECKYCVILDLVQELEWKLVEDARLQTKVNLYWIDVATIHEHFRHIQPWQMINHFPGMPNIARKNRMGQNLNSLQKIFPKEYSFYPRTWVLPGEMADFRSQFDNMGNSLGNKIFIIKPDAGCQGRGIFLTRTIENVPFNENVVAQVYIKKPLLLDGFKFDLRLYVIVTSVKPLRMYLFHDGLVRMCTEEYVKPTKDNLGVSCMHLTNYAVNKHNENFLQPAAQSSEDYNTQDDASKKSLMWFMNWVKKDHGEAKSNWLWKRFGTLCTRTVIAILPTLSREYDQHFKSFNGIPVDISKIPTSSSLSSSAATVLAGFSPTAAAAAAAHAKPPTTTKSSASAPSLPGRNRAPSRGGSDNDEDEDEDKRNTDTETNAGGESSSTNADNDEYPKTRGSRCFEVLGFDIMLDSNLNPWLIEVNHLPSFGTDSPLDKDIKDRLMRQVFSVLPTMADDQAAYMAFHKAESEKRLNAHKAAKERELKELKEKPKPNLPNRPSDRKREGHSVERVSPGGGIAETEENKDDTSSLRNENQENEEQREQEQPQENEPGTQESNYDNSENNPTSSSNPDENALDIIDEECSPERLEEIKEILLDIYEKRSPEKINKIDRLLAKYIGHEEEFLKFVFSKYNVTSNEYEKSLPKSQRDALAAKAANNNNNISQNNQENNNNKFGGVRSADASTVATEKNNRNNNRNDPKRYSRSVSPPRSTGPKRTAPAWKSSTPDEDAIFRLVLFYF
jgi:tubulin polyglutamylase TTLL6/13